MGFFMPMPIRTTHTSECIHSLTGESGASKGGWLAPSSEGADAARDKSTGRQTESQMHRRPKDGLAFLPACLLHQCLMDCSQWSFASGIRLAITEPPLSFPARSCLPPRSSRLVTEARVPIAHSLGSCPLQHREELDVAGGLCPVGCWPAALLSVRCRGFRFVGVE